MISLLQKLKGTVLEVTATGTQDTMRHTWKHLNYRLDVCPATDGAHIEMIQPERNTRVYPKFSGLAAWGENWKWYSPLPLSAVVSLFFESV
jgi:hypothetical protein